MCKNVVNQCVKELVCFDYSKNVLIFSKGHLFCISWAAKEESKEVVNPSHFPHGLLNRAKERS